MKLRDFNLLTDENIPPAVVHFLRQKGFSIFDVKESGLSSSTDQALLDIATKDRLVIVTQDNDFTASFFQLRVRDVGIIYLKPGHVSSEVTIVTLDAVLKTKFDLSIPFIVIAENKNTPVKIRYRQLMTP